MWDVSDPQISSVGKQDKTLFSHPMQNGMDGHHFSKVYENGLNYTNYTVSSYGRIVYHMHPHATCLSLSLIKFIKFYQPLGPYSGTM